VETQTCVDSRVNTRTIYSGQNNQTFDLNERFRRLFVGVDVHKDNHAAVALNCFGETEGLVEISNEFEGFGLLAERIREIAEKKNLIPVFGLEDTYGSGDFLARYLVGQGFEVKTVNPVLVRRERDFETHPEKSDVMDAKGVAKVLIQRIDTLPKYTVTETREIANDLRSLVNDRETIVQEQTAVKNQLHRCLHRTWGSNYRSVFKDIFGKKALGFWIDFPSAIDLKASRKHVAKPDWIKEARHEELPLASQVLKNQIRRKAKRLLAIKEELQEIQAELEETNAKAGQKLESLPGCGTVLSAVILSEIKDIERFKTPAQLAKYAGLAPRALESGKKKRHVKTRSGNRRLNKALYQIALSQIGIQGIPKAKDYFQKKVSENKSKKHALTCLRRQIIDIVWSMLKENRVYYP
jgi:transposase